MATLDGEFELEDELGLQGEFELEDELEGEDFLGTLAEGGGGLFGLGEGEDEFEDEGEGEWEYEGELEDEGEDFFKKGGFGAFLKRAAPLLKKVARVAAPIVGTAVGGPLGSVLGKVAASALREGELELELEDEFEGEPEGEAELEAAISGPPTSTQALAELMAAVAAKAPTDLEAEAMAGAAVVAAISPQDRAVLRGVLASLVRGSAVLTRILRRRKETRPAVRVIPSVARRAATVLARRAASGRPVTRQTAARVMAKQTRRVLGNPRTCAAALKRNKKGTQVARKAGAGTSRPLPGAVPRRNGRPLPLR